MFLGPLSQVIYGPLALKATAEDLLGLLMWPSGEEKPRLEIPVVLVLQVLVSWLVVVLILVVAQVLVSWLVVVLQQVLVSWLVVLAP